MKKTKQTDVTAELDKSFGPEASQPIALEPRIAFDAAAGAELVESSVDALEAQDETVSQGNDDTADLAEALSAATAGADDAVHVVFIDAGVENPEALIASVPAGA